MAPEDRRHSERQRKSVLKSRGREGGRAAPTGAQRRERGRKSERGPRQRDIVQIAESRDIDHRGAAAAEPSGTDTSDLTVLSIPPLPLPLPSLLPTRPLPIHDVATPVPPSFSRDTARLLPYPAKKRFLPPGCYILKICFGLDSRPRCPDHRTGFPSSIARRCASRYFNWYIFERRERISRSAALVFVCGLLAPRISVSVESRRCSLLYTKVDNWTRLAYSSRASAGFYLLPPAPPAYI